MKTETTAPRSSSRLTTLCTGALIAMAAVAPRAGIADPASADTRLVNVSLADLDLATPAGARAAHERLQAMAQRVCATSSDGRNLSHQANFAACVDNAVADALRQLNRSTFNSVTRAASVSLADLDLSTSAGLRTARERLQAMAQRVCSELAQGADFAYQPNFAACARVTLSGALAQLDALRAAKQSRTAMQTAP